MIQNDDTPEMIVYKLKFLGLIIVFSALFWWIGTGMYSMLIGLFCSLSVVYVRLKKQEADSKNQEKNHNEVI